MNRSLAAIERNLEIMIQKAVVRKILDPKRAEIEVQRQSACGHDCAHCGGCGAPLERIQAVAINHVGAKVGDVVTIEAENGQLMRMAAIVYTLPLLLFFVFFIVASLCGLGEGAAGGCGGIGLIAGVAFAVGYNKKVKKSGGTPFTIIKIG